MKRRAFLLLAFLLVASVSQGEPQKPDSAEILKKLRPEHPRLLARGSDFEALRQQVKAGEAAQWAKSVRDAADALLKVPPSTYSIPDGKRLLATSRQVLDRSIALGLAFQLGGERAHVDRLWKELDAAAHFPDWNPRHYLDTAEMTAGFAIAYDWLYDQWTPEQRATIRQAIVEKGLKQSLDIYQKNRWWAAAEHNWNQVCNGGMTLGALAVAGEEPALAGEILQAAVRSVPRAMRHFAPDGAWGEGPGYWDYATKYNVLMVASLQSALGTDFGLSDMEGFSHAADFAIQTQGPIGHTFNYADAGDHGGGGPQMFWLATRFDSAPVAAWRVSRVGNRPDPLDLLWGAAWLARKPTLGELPLAKYFRGTEIVTMRSAWDDARATFVGFKGGDNAVNHGHLDLGSFVLDAAGQRWAIDLGSDDYNLPGYFGPKRWTYYRCRAEGHNTLVLNPGAEPDQDVKATAPIARFESKPGRTFAIADLSAAYAGAGAKVQRGIQLSGKDVLVQDEITGAKQADVWWFLHTRAQVQCDGAIATLSQGGERLTARILQPKGATFQVLPAEPFASSPHPPRQQVKGVASELGPEGVRKLAIHLQGAIDVIVTVQLTPEKSLTPAPLKPLVQW